jgi:predicted DNA-binding transcriptional regulator AlpA
VGFFEDIHSYLLSPFFLRRVQVKKSRDQEPDALVHDSKVIAELGITKMTLWRWEQNAEKEFPARIRIGKRNYRSRRSLDNFKARLFNGEFAEESHAPDRQRDRP